jgi:lysozyme
MNISSNCIKIVTEFEGFSEKPYLDVVRVPTIGYGTTVYSNGNKVKMTDSLISKENAIKELTYHINQLCIPYIKSNIKVELNQNQFDALCSFIYNIGAGNFIKSTLLKKINNKDFNGAADEFLKWNKASGKVFPGLTKRREAERKLFLR